MLACSKGDWFGKRHNIDRHILDNFNAVSIDPFEERKRERETGQVLTKVRNTS